MRLLLSEVRHAKTNKSVSLSSVYIYDMFLEGAALNCEETRPTKRWVSSRRPQLRTKPKKKMSDLSSHWYLTRFLSTFFVDNVSHFDFYLMMGNKSSSIDSNFFFFVEFFILKWLVDALNLVVDAKFDVLLPQEPKRFPMTFEGWNSASVASWYKLHSILSKSYS